MEPPAKRRRQGKSPLDGADHDDDSDDDDELSFEPHEVLAKRDPGYKLSLERAYSDNRFQATMAHIFDKYGRDFDGIGDEIDMVTGEIVVDNGHLQNMRNEGDVGVPGIGGEDEDEDDGILLRDLTNDEPPWPRGQGDGARAEAEDEEDEEDRIMHGREAHHRKLDALVPVNRLRPSPESGRPPISLSSLHAMPAFGASPLAFAASPFSMDPWTLPNHISGSSWRSSDIFSRPSRLLPSARERYDFPVQTRGGSIWAPNYRFKDNEPDRAVALNRLQPSLRTRTRPMKNILPSAVPEASEEEQVDEDAILTGKSYVDDQMTEVDEARAHDHDDDLLVSETPQPSMPARREVRQTRSQSAVKATTSGTSSSRDKQGPAEIPASTKKQRARSASSEAASEPRPTSQPQTPEESQPDSAKKDAEDQDKAQDAPSRRRSKRDRKQVEYLGKTPWGQASEQRRPQQAIVVQLPPLDSSSRGDYETVDDAVDEVADSANEEPGSSGSADKKADDRAAESPRVEQVVPDSQEAFLSHSNDGPGGKAPDNDKKEVDQPYYAVNSVYVLSDDEMPIPSRRKPPNDRTHEMKPTVPTTFPGPPDSGIGDSVATPSSTEDTEQQRAPADAASSNLQPAPRRRSKRRRPRKPDGAPDNDRPEQEPSEQPPPAPATHSAAGTPSTAASADGKSRRLTRELRWLQKLNAPGAEMPPERSRSAGEGQARTPRPAGCRHGIKDGKHIPPAQRQEDGDQEAQQASTPPDSAISDDTADTQPNIQKHTPTTSPTKPPQASKPQTPRHTYLPTKAPSSRRSILSLLSSASVVAAGDDDDENDLDELGHSLAGSLPACFFSSGASRKIWKSSARTTEIYHTPVKRRPTDVVSPGSIIKTPGGTVRTCGIDGYRCGRDFCFTCL